MDRIFEPFFTTKERGKGAGLGLAMVYGTVLSHNGFIGVRSQKGEGAEFVMHLPVSTRRPAEEVEHEGTRTAPGRGTVLVVDDEPLMLDFACEAVRELGYGALAATEGAQACAIFAENYPHIKAILLDMVMPGTSWEAIIEAILTTDPHARIIVASGYNGSREAQRVLEAGAVAFIGKPYTVDELGRVLQKALSNDPTD